MVKLSKIFVAVEEREKLSLANVTQVKGMKGEQDDDLEEIAKDITHATGATSTEIGDNDFIMSDTSAVGQLNSNSAHRNTPGPDEMDDSNDDEEATPAAAAEDEDDNDNEPPNITLDATLIDPALLMDGNSALSPKPQQSGDDLSGVIAASHSPAQETHMPTHLPVVPVPSTVRNQPVAKNSRQHLGAIDENSENRPVRRSGRSSEKATSLTAIPTSGQWVIDATAYLEEAFHCIPFSGGIINALKEFEKSLGYPSSKVRTHSY
jgi:hypothetical protein